MQAGHATYDLVAPEYYDPIRHPTSANFREASRLLLRLWLPILGESPGCIYEVGAGDSLVAAELRRENLPLRNLVLTDRSESMLSRSAPWYDWGARLVIADAQSLPFDDSSGSSVISILGDPYVERRLWHEMFRVLRPGGIVLFTTPSYQWASAYRSATGSPIWEAEFELRSGSRCRLSSRVLEQEKQIAEIEEAGLTVKETEAIDIRELEEPLSPKLMRERGPDASIVTGYLAMK